ncbi:MAG TPA: hypothetical protein ENN46_01070, partial [Candidatus Woesearchaeota archaeon]|nr:hypothetical protein [Candidatus Woesearchaeota archaeon]
MAIGMLARVIIILVLVLILIVAIGPRLFDTVRPVFERLGIDIIPKERDQPIGTVSDLALDVANRFDERVRGSSGTVNEINLGRENRIPTGYSVVYGIVKDGEDVKPVRVVLATSTAPRLGKAGLSEVGLERDTIGIKKSSDSVIDFTYIDSFYWKMKNSYEPEDSGKTIPLNIIAYWLSDKEKKVLFADSYEKEKLKILTPLADYIGKALTDEEIFITFILLPEHSSIIFSDKYNKKLPNEGSIDRNQYSCISGSCDCYFKMDGFVLFYDRKPEFCSNPCGVYSDDNYECSDWFINIKINDEPLADSLG